MTYPSGDELRGVFWACTIVIGLIGAAFGAAAFAVFYWAVQHLSIAIH